METLNETRNDINKTINEILTSIYQGHITSFNKIDNLFDEGILDSFGVVNLVQLLEETFELRISAEELIMENFKDISQIVSLVMRLQELRK